MVSGAEKLKLVREISVIRHSLPNANGANKLVLVKRIRDIRQLLSIEVDNPNELVIDKDDPQVYRKLADYINNVTAKMPNYFYLAEMMILEKIESLSTNSSVEYPYDYANVVSAIFKEIGDEDQQKKDLLEHYKAAGNVFETDTELANSISRLITDELNAKAVDTPEFKAIYESADAEYNAINEKMSALMDINSFNGYDEAAISQAYEDYKVLNEQRTIAWKKVSDASRLKYQAKQDRVDALKAQIQPIGDRVISTLLSGSKITQQQADEWANSQEISKTAQNRLKKLGYPLEDVRRDMAEFHRLSGGKLRGIIVDSDGRKRANAGKIGHVEGSIIRIGSKFNKATLFHELAHHLEADPTAKLAANGFLIKRRKSADLYRLKSLTGNSGYRSDEVAYQDEFINHYIGKKYKDEITEVFSMGVQYLSNPTDAALLIGRDPEMAALIIGYLQADLSPAMKALQSIQDGKKSDNETKREDEQAQYKFAVEQLAKKVSIVDDGWFNDLDQADKDNITGYGYFNYYGLGDDLKFIGSWQGFRVFSGKIKRFGNKRKSKGYSVVYTPKTGSLFNQDTGSRSLLTGCPFHGSIEEMKAVMLIAQQHYENDIYQTYRELVYWQGGNLKIIRYAGESNNG